MNHLWQSEDGYVLVVDAVEFPDEDGEGTNDIAALFKAGAWVLIWRADEGDGLWHVTRSRQKEKPNLYQLRGRMDWDMAHAWLIAPSGAGGRQNRECEADPIAFGKVLYAAWGEIALQHLPAKIEFLGLNTDDYAPMAIPAWLRPGIPLHKVRRQEMRALLEEIAA